MSAQRSVDDRRRLDRHLVLIGMSGAGKSSVGRICAERLGAEFVDADDVVETSAGCSIRELFESEGEHGFRRREHEVLVSLLGREEPAVIASGGGVVLLDENRELLASPRARVIWLRIEPQALEQRVRNRTHRPLLDGDSVAALQAMWVEREPLYRQVADAIVSVEHRSVADVVEAVLR
jgi:shikimate kinase